MKLDVLKGLSSSRKQILLVSCYELGHPPFGLALLTGLLDPARFSTEIIDLAIDPIVPEKVQQADFVGISVPMHTALRIGVRAARQIRKIHPTVPIVFFGLYAALNADFLLSDSADFVIGGEYERPLQSLIDASFCSEAVYRIPGVSRKGDVVPPNMKPGPWAKPIRTPLPPLSRYARLEKGGNRLLVGYVEASRGCRHLCRHCPIPPVYQGRFTVVPEKLIRDDIAAQVDQGASHITFGDPDFLNGPNHSIKIARALHRSFPDVTFDITAKIEHLLKYQALVPELAACGCIFIVSAVESLSDTVLGHLHKGHTGMDVIHAIEIVQAAGMTLRPSLVPFTPWSTIEDYIALFDFAEQHSLVEAIDPIQYTIRLLIPPGSLLLQESSMATYLGPLIPDLFTYSWTHPDPRMDQLQGRVTKIVEEGQQDDSEAVFYRLKECGYALHEARSENPIMTVLHPNPSKLPRLTESWFCCSEPTLNQIASIE